MSLRKLGLALLAVFALGAIAASSAFAENEFNEEATSAWYTGASPGTKLAEGSTKVVKTSAATNLVLKSTVGGKALKLEGTGVNCLSCVIKNVGTAAKSEGTLEFTGVKLLEPEPAVCSVASTIKTNPLTATVRMKKGSTTVDTVKFVPTSGTTFVLIEILGASCSVKGTYKVSGAAFGEPSNATGIFAETQPLKFSETIQKSAGTSTSLTFGANPAYLEGTVNNFLEPKTPFAAKEK